MSLERWGSLSVSDHVDIHALIANVLLYDRLIIPVMTEQEDRDERVYWSKHGWEPDVQKTRLSQLGDLAIKRAWDKTRRQNFSGRYAQLTAEKSDATALQFTRRILAEEPIELPVGVDGVEVVAAYSSLEALRKDFDVKAASDRQAAQALLISRRLKVPNEENPEKSLAVAIKLSRDPEFRARRGELFEWQATSRAKNLEPNSAVNHLAELVGKYNEKVQAASSNVTAKLAFTVVGVGIGFAAGGPLGATAAGAALTLLQFATFDSKPVVEAGSLSPFAMFHDIKRELGYELGE